MKNVYQFFIIIAFILDATTLIITFDTKFL